MSDVFISYSKADHALALKLAAYLESEGWSVWWDKSLGAADLYRDEIMKQLAAARAVISIWTPTSVKSDWVRAEAGRAKADGKLIPVKTSEVSYTDIPLPFGEMHTENVDSTDLIRAAVVAQLAKPAIPVSEFWQITSTFKYQVLTWIGVVASAITLFANLNGVLQLADWARELATHWHEWTQVFWGIVFGLVKIKVPKEFVPIISFIASVAILVAGVNLSARNIKSEVKSQHSLPMKRKLYLAGGGVLVFLLIAPLLTLAGIVIGIHTVVFKVVEYLEKAIFGGNELVLNIWTIVMLLGYLLMPLSYLVYYTETRLWVIANSLLFLFVSVCLLVLPFNALRGYDETYITIAIGISMILLQVCWIAVIVFSPIQQLTRRLGFVVLGVLTLVALSEISKLDLHQYLRPAKISSQLDGIWQLFLIAV